MAIGFNSRKGYRAELKGFSETLRNLKLTKNQQGNLQNFLKKEANKVIATAKAIVPVDTGRLRDSHRVLTGGATGRNFVKVNIVVGGIIIRGRFVNYAAAVHEGSPSFPARPWLAMAVKAHAPGYMDRLRRAIKLPKAVRRFK
jgi:hypothetical protein